MSQVPLERDPRRREREAYERETGRSVPSLADGDPLAWQYDWRGTKQERDRLRAELLHEAAEADEPPPVIEGQESLL